MRTPKCLSCKSESTIIACTIMWNQAPTSLFSCFFFKYCYALEFTRACAHACRISISKSKFKIPNHRPFEQISSTPEYRHALFAHMHLIQTRKLYKSCLPWNGKLSDGDGCSLNFKFNQIANIEWNVSN